MTSSVSIIRSIPLNRDAIVPLLREQFEILQEASERGAVVLAARIPGSGSVAVPVRVGVSYPAPRSPRFGLTVAALKTPALYPRFRGDVEVTDAGTAATTITLSGEYHVPLGLLGRAFDATTARGIAPRGLEDLLDRLVADLLAAVAQRADAAYRSARHGE
jgi:hypothetical protein